MQVKASNKPWIGVDLDATLAHYDHWVNVLHIGAPIVPMVERVKQWVREGKQVRIFTARIVNPEDGTISPVAIDAIEAWCEEHIGYALPVTNQKDLHMVELWDDRCVQVEPNTGEPVTYWQSRI